MKLRTPPRRHMIALVCALATLSSAGATALPLEEAEVSRHPQAMVLFESPPADRPVFGDAVVEVRVSADAVEAVVFFVDGVEIGSLAQPPYRLPVSLGENLGGHRFEVVVESAEGEIARAVRVTPTLHIDERIDLDLQQLYVTVEGFEEGRPQLTVTDFEVRDDGRKQQIVTFEGGDAALTVALLVDASESMRGGRLEAALEGAHSFLRGMRELDEAAVFLFSDTIRQRTEFSQEASRLRTALGSVEGLGGTALNDALYAAIRQLEIRQGRRVAILLSDGVDIHSVLGIADVLWAVRRSRAVVYWIALEEGVKGSVLSPWRDSTEHDAERQGLRRLVDESGGKVISIATAVEAAGAFTAILDELRQQYVLGYYPVRRTRDGTWHKVSVQLNRRGLEARTRGGYVDW